MEKIYKCKNGTIHVTLPKSCDREKLKKVTEEFLKKVISGGKKNVHSNTSRNL
jgi:gamma-glutamyl-gamma-aminobutyrate hydrolase PuuD